MSVDNLGLLGFVMMDWGPRLELGNKSVEALVWFHALHFRAKILNTIPTDGFQYSLFSSAYSVLSLIQLPNGQYVNRLVKMISRPCFQDQDCRFASAKTEIIFKKQCEEDKGN